MKAAPAPRTYRSLALFLAVCLAAGYLGSLATVTGLEDWYSGLQKPYLNPPGWVFGPVWSVLYVLMAFAGWRLWSAGSERRTRLRTLYVVQLTLNALWSPAFFGLRSPLAGLAVIWLLWTALLTLTRTAWREDRVSGILLAPYLVWVTFAAYLNWGLWHLNR